VSEQAKPLGQARVRSARARAEIYFEHGRSRAIIPKKSPAAKRARNVLFTVFIIAIALAVAITIFVLQSISHWY
jgi:hypothetical protein